EWGRGPGAGHIFTLRLAQKAIILSCLTRQPSCIVHRTFPRHVDHWETTASPALIGGLIAVAAAVSHAGIPFLKGYRKRGNVERPSNRHLMLRAFIQMLEMFFRVFLITRGCSHRK